MLVKRVRFEVKMWCFYLQEEAAKKYVDFGTKFLKESGISSDVGVV